MNESNLPTREECFDIIQEYHVPSHILSHSLAVSKLAIFLAQKLKEKGLQVNVEQVERACLLHDKIVLLKDRLEDGHKRNALLHGTNPQSKINMAKVDNLIYRLEKQIFEKIGLDPTAVTDEFIDLYNHNIKDNYSENNNHI